MALKLPGPSWNCTIRVKKEDFVRVYETDTYIWKFLDFYGDPHVAVGRNASIAEKWHSIRNPSTRIFIAGNILEHDEEKSLVRLHWEIPVVLVPDALEVWLSNDLVEKL